MRERNPTPATIVADHLVALHGKRHAHRILDRILDQIPVVDLAGLAFDWDGFWARPKQVVPDSNWRSFGNLGARGTGKTATCAHHINREVFAGRISVMSMCAQNLEKTLSAQVKGLIDAAPPRFKPEFRSSSNELVWPNGAIAYAFTPEVPGAIRSPNNNLCWLSEIQSWPVATREEALLNFRFATRVGYARTIWDATPKRGHAILKRFLARAAKAPDKHIIVREAMRDNIRNLNADEVAELEADFAGTRQGREELLGEMLDDSDNALVKQAWIDDHRRQRPERFVMRVIGVDPALTKRRGNDCTGIVEAGLGVDGQLYVLADHSGKYSPTEWASKVLRSYVDGRCDVVIVERNAGGDLVEANLRSYAESMRLNVQKVSETDRPSHVVGTVFFREVHAVGPKEDRAQPLSTAYEKGRISHVAKFESLEEMLTSWEPGTGQHSPDALDALVHAATDLLGLMKNSHPETSHRGVIEANAALARPSRVSSVPIVYRGGGGRI